MTTATIQISRSEVMKEAWGNMAIWLANGPRTAAELRRRLSYELRLAWGTIKLRAFRKAQEAAATPADRARDALSMIENKDHCTAADHAEADRLRSEIAREDAAEAEAERAAKRDLIASAKGRFCAVTFIKKDGSERVMNIQPAALPKHVKGDDASEAGRKAAATRKERHPHLLPVWDVAAQGVRSVNLDTVKTIAIDGMAYAYA